MVFGGIKSKDFEFHKGGGNFGVGEVERESGFDAGHYVGFVFSKSARDGIGGGIKKGGAFRNGGVGVGLDVKVRHVWSSLLLSISYYLGAGRKRRVCQRSLRWQRERLATALVAPELNVKAVGEAKSMGEASLRDPGSVFCKSGGSAPFGHEKKAAGGNIEFLLESENFSQVVFASEDKLEKGFGRFGEELHRRILNTKLGSVAGIGELGGDIVLGHGLVEEVVGLLGAVGFDFDGRKGVGDFFKKRDEFLLLEKRFPAGDDQPVTHVRLRTKGFGQFVRWELDDLVAFGKLLLVLMGPGSPFPIPSERGIAPRAMEVAKGEPEKDGRGSEGGAFALQGAKDFGRAVWEAGDFHAR